jgi:predicted MFS family arabinose efflux permease
MFGRWGLIAAVALARVAFGYQFQSVASLAPDLVRAFGLDYASLGTLIGLYMAPGVLVALPGGLLGRRYGERAFLAGGLVLMTVGPVAAALATTPAALGAGRMLAGTGAVLLTVLQGKLVADRFEGRAFVTAMSLTVGAFPLGVGLCGLLRAPLAGRIGWQGVTALGGGIALAAFVVFALTPGLPSQAARRWSLPSRREAERSLVAGVIWTFYNAGFVGFLAYVPSLLAHEGRGPAEAALLLAIGTWPNFPATLLGGALAGRWGEGRVFLAGMVAVALTVTGIALVGPPLPWSLAFGTLAALHPGVIVAVGTLSARPENRAVGMGLFYTVYYIGGAVLPGLCGRAADWAGTPAAALVTAAAISLLALPFWWLNRRLA